MEMYIGLFLHDLILSGFMNLTCFNVGKHFVLVHFTVKITPLSYMFFDSNELLTKVGREMTEMNVFTKTPINLSNSKKKDWSKEMFLDQG